MDEIEVHIFSDKIKDFADDFVNFWISENADDSESYPQIMSFSDFTREFVHYIEQQL